MFYILTIVLPGGSVNIMLYNRPSASDFDDWGVEDWTSGELIQLMQNVGSFDPIFPTYLIPHS
jgi:alcohol oxidase